MKKSVYYIQYLLLAAILLLFKALPLDKASAAGGWLFRLVGPRLGANRKAHKNLKAAFPGMGEAERKKIVLGMWDNLGRVIAEYPHLPQIGKERITLENPEILENLYTEGGPSILISAHVANWEASAAGQLMRYNIPLNLTYRPLNNPYAEKLLYDYRTMGGKLTAYTKSREGAMQMLKALREGKMLGILVDQKYNEGIPAHFFGRPAMSTPIYVQLGQRYKCPVVPVQIIRENGAHFRVRPFKPLELFDAEGKPRDAQPVVEEVNALIESWVRAYPEQWLWLHRRWNERAERMYKEMKEAA
jgi:KDO2-lipid IV(A) lauroyltransferase